MPAGLHPFCPSGPSGLHAPAVPSRAVHDITLGAKKATAFCSVAFWVNKAKKTSLDYGPIGLVALARDSRHFASGKGCPALSILRFAHLTRLPAGEARRGAARVRQTQGTSQHQGHKPRGHAPRA